MMDDILNHLEYENRTFDQNIANIWSIGLTLLSAASLTSGEIIYDYNLL